MLVDLATTMDDFADVGSKVSTSKTDLKRPRDEGHARTGLRVYETLPPQLLNAYGEAKFSKLPDSEVWKNLSKPLKSGAMYMTEFCSASDERRGIAANRWLHAMVMYCQHQLDEKTKQQNKAIMDTKKYDELYVEI